MPGSVLQIMGEVFSGVAGVFLIIASVGRDWVEVQFFRTTHVITWGLWDICVGGLCLPDSGIYIFMNPIYKSSNVGDVSLPSIETKTPIVQCSHFLTGMNRGMFIRINGC